MPIIPNLVSMDRPQMFVVPLYRFRLHAFVNEGGEQITPPMTVQQAKNALPEGNYELLVGTRGYKFADSSGNPVGDFLINLPLNSVVLPGDFH